ncbi:lysozyme [Enterobacter ludwigii]|uniref:lysozyme n=1 Tax=Enterobacter ludwigii TaxID=299767 RepID=UPI0039762E43
MNISEKGLALIKHFEGLQLEAYQCSASVWSIGYGHTRGVMPGDSITEDDAEDLLRQDTREAEQSVHRLVTVKLAQNQFDALVSFTFNLGSGALQRSTLLKRLNVGDYQAAAAEFPRWVYSGGERLSGLVRRRTAEKALFEQNSCK